MRRETKEKIKTGWYRFKNWAGEWLPPIAVGGVIGAAVTGYIGAIENNIKINRLSKRVDRHGELIDQHADAGNAWAEQCMEDRERIEELERRQALLMEQSLKAIDK